MDKIEVTGRTLDEAVQMAARELRVTADSVEYEVVEEGTRGFLGLGQSPTVITAWRKEGAVEAPEVEEPVPEVVEEEQVQVRPEAKAEREAPPAAAPPAAGTTAEVTMRILRDMLEASSLDVRPTLKTETADEVVVEIAGKDVAILIGKRGQTLDALQYLISIGASKQSVDRKRVVVDAEGYRDRHRAFLERTAHEYARAVKAQGQEAVLDPQPARDRRIIHLALADDPDVYTYSEGEGEDRHVVISPKK